MQTIQLKVRDDIYFKILDFLKLLPKNSVQLEYPEISEDEIKQKLQRAEKDIEDGKTITMKDAKEKLLNRLS